MGMEKYRSGSQVIRLWKIEKNKHHEITKSKLDLEERLEEWLAKDPSIISPDLLIIGRQVQTHGGPLDLLGMQENGDLVIMELKRDKTPREITLQVLDYATWVKQLDVYKIQDIANEYLQRVLSVSFEEAYRKKFTSELPESINEHHKMYVIGSEIDESSQRIIKYLSEDYGVDINAITFNYFKDQDAEFLARVFLIEPSTQVVKQATRIMYLPPGMLQEIADEKGVGEIYSYLATELNSLFDSKGTTLNSLAFSGRQDGRMNTIMSLIPTKSSKDEGLKFQVYTKRFAKFFNIKDDEAVLILPKSKEWQLSKKDLELVGHEGYFRDLGQAKAFIAKLRKDKSLG